MRVLLKSVLLKAITGSLFLPILCFSNTDNNDIKFNALYILNFAKYITWPDTSSNEINVTVLGADPVFYELKRISNVISSGKKLKVSTQNDIDKIVDTDIIFIPEKRSDDLPEIKKMINGKPVLIVTNKKGMILNGAGINLVNLYWKLRYEINLKYLEEHGLIADSILFKLGKVIQ